MVQHGRLSFRVRGPAIAAAPPVSFLNIPRPELLVHLPTTHRLYHVFTSVYANETPFLFPFLKLHLLHFSVI